jgi:hypothetical protein
MSGKIQIRVPKDRIAAFCNTRKVTGPALFGSLRREVEKRLVEESRNYIRRKRILPHMEGDEDDVSGLGWQSVYGETTIGDVLRVEL